MIILGIDPGIARTGWGVIEKSGQNLSLIKYGCIETKPCLTPVKRLMNVHNGIIKVTKKFKSSSVAVEDLFFNTNAKTAMKVGEARGAILIALESQKIPISHYTPLQIKTAVTSYGRASKSQVQRMVKTLLNLDHIPKPDDAADAIATAITHAFTVKHS